MKIQHRSEKATEREQILSSVFYSILRIYEKLLSAYTIQKYTHVQKQL